MVPPTTSKSRPIDRDRDRDRGATPSGAQAAVAQHALPARRTSVIHAGARVVRGIAKQAKATLTGARLPAPKILDALKTPAAPDVLGGAQTAEGLSAAKKKTSAVRLSVSGRIDVDIDKDALIGLAREAPDIAAAVLPLLPMLAKLYAALDPASKKAIADGLASAASQFGAGVTTQTKEMAFSGARSLAASALSAPFKIAARGADLVLGEKRE